MVTYNNCSDVLKWRYVDDEETGLYYLRSRYYNSNQCRFINADILLYDNLFSYCDNSPVDYCDINGFSKDPGRGFQPVSRTGEYSDWYFRIDNDEFLNSPHIHLLQFRHNTDIAEYSVQANGKAHEDLPLPNKKAKEVLENGDKVKKKWPPKNPGNSSGGTSGKKNKHNKHVGKATSVKAVCIADTINGANQTMGIALPYSLPFSTGLAGNTTGSYMPTSYQPTTFTLPDFSFLSSMFSVAEDEPIMEVCFGIP